MKKDRNNRREKILQALTEMLEREPGERLTTAKLADAVGVSEAALYRHFPSKGKIYDSLIDRIESDLFGKDLVGKDGLQASESLLSGLLSLAQGNPGLSRILVGDVLVGENARLRERVRGIFNRVETEVAGLLRRSCEHGQLVANATTESTANLLLAVVEGRIHMFVRSDFSLLPLLHWQEQWALLVRMLGAG